MLHETLRFEKVNVVSNVTIVFFSNVSLKIFKKGNFGLKFKEPFMNCTDNNDIKV